jgi:hypothetical protein
MSETLREPNGNTAPARETEDGKAISCLQDVPSVARLADRQLFLTRWYYAVGIAPFAVFIFTALKFFPNSTNRIFDVLVYLTLGWAFFVSVYTLYLMFAVRCPACNSRYGAAEQCGSCGLPRYSSLAVSQF